MGDIPASLHHVPRRFCRILLLWPVPRVASTGLTAFRPKSPPSDRSKGAVVKIDGQLFTEYLVRSGTKPILWPIIGPTGKPMTRDYPLRDRAGEKTDHPHQRSLWFTHGDVERRQLLGRAGEGRHDQTSGVHEGRRRKARP